MIRFKRNVPVCSQNKTTHDGNKAQIKHAMYTSFYERVQTLVYFLDKWNILSDTLMETNKTINPCTSFYKRVQTNDVRSKRKAHGNK